MFNTKEYNDGFLQNIFRTIFFLNWNEGKIDGFDSIVSDSLFNQFVENLREKISISNLRNTDVLITSYTSTHPY